MGLEPQVAHGPPTVALNTFVEMKKNKWMLLNIKGLKFFL